MAIGIPFLVIGNAFSSIIRAEGKAGKAMAGKVNGNLANINLDPIMIIGMGMNGGGAAAGKKNGKVPSAVF